MAGTIAVIPTTAIEHKIRNEWEISFGRFIPYPNALTTSSSNLHPLPPRTRKRYPRGNWISSSSAAFLRLATKLSIPDAILTVSFNSNLLEEHYVSSLHFSWPQVSCVSGFPARGVRTVLASYRDSLGEIQKFAMRFSSFYEAEAFINALKDILKNEEPEPLNTDFGSEISSHSGFMSSNKHYHRICEEPSFMNPVDTYIPQLPPCKKNEGGRSSGSQEKEPYTPQMPPCMKNEGGRYSGSQEIESYIPQMPPGFTNEGEQLLGSQEKETIPFHNFEGMLPSLPPSFASLLMDCSEINHAQSTVPEEVDLKSQILRYMEDSSFQDMLVKVEKVISELGGNMSL